ncbi:MAG: carboxypeptidase regulatory-like domain-containing protein [Deltaproteobacteria bacterium]|nr:carboxypeptidase regulatory-like domain-containing protein [Deltaproteobacteria bacterium]
MTKALRRRSIRAIVIASVAFVMAGGVLAQAPSGSPSAPERPAGTPGRTDRAQKAPPAPDEPEPVPPGHPSVAPGDEAPGGEAPPGDHEEPLPPGHPPIGGAGPAPTGDSNDDHEEPLPPGHPPIGGGGGAPPSDDGAAGGAQGGDPHGGGGGGRGEGLALPQPPPSSAMPDRAIPAGVVRITVVDAEGRPLANERVELGTLGGMERRERVSGTTRADGTFEWRGLATGSEQAYRASVLYQGARFGAEPFQLPPDRGYRVRIARTGVTRSGQKVLLFAGRTTIEVRDERLVVSQSMQLVNFDEQTWVLPARGVRIGFPPGFTAFQNEPTMSDLRVSADEHGAIIAGSMPPGESRVVYGFHVPYSGSDFTLRTDVPFRTVIYEVLIEAARGMTAEVEGFPPLQEMEDDGRRILGSRLSRRPGAPEFDVLEIRLTGIPGPGGGRWIALLVALLVVAGGFAYLFFGSTKDPRARAATFAREKSVLLDQIEALERAHASNDVGPKTYRRRRDELMRELASLLREERSSGRA